MVGIIKMCICRGVGQSFTYRKVHCTYFCFYIRPGEKTKNIRHAFCQNSKILHSTAKFFLVQKRKDFSITVLTAHYKT